jgi:hypothetical protein
MRSCPLSQPLRVVHLPRLPCLPCTPRRPGATRVGRWVVAWLAVACAGPAAAQSRGYDFAFERELLKSRFEQEIRFREAAIHITWAAERLCASRTEVEPFVLWSTHALRRRLSAQETTLLREVTGMDDKWRVAWMDEAAPDALQLGDVVVAVNGRELPAGGTRVSPSALLSGGSLFSSDDQAFWDVVHAARREAEAGKPFTITLENGRTLVSATQTGCAGSVAASAFDADPNLFARLAAQRVKIPANALIEARTRDEFLWLAAFAIYFQASEQALAQARKADGMSTAFTVGKIFALALPGGGLLLTAVEAQNERRLLVDSIVGSADLFANEVVAALGGDPEAGYRLSDRMHALGMKVEVVMMDTLRRSNAVEHARRLRELQAAQAAAEQRELEREEEAARRASEAGRTAAPAGAATTEPARR